MKTIPPFIWLVVPVSITVARALWTREKIFLAGERTRARVQCSAVSLNATAVGRRRASHSRTVTSRSLPLLALVSLAATILFASTLPPAFAQGIGGGPSNPSSGGPDTPGNGNDNEGPWE